MLAKTITYTDFNGVNQTQKEYFNLTKSELMEMQMSVQGGLTGLLTSIAETNDNVLLMKYFKKIIVKSYGIKSADGKEFIKSKKIAKKFVNSAAYDSLFVELFSDENKLMEFIKGIVPSDVREQINDEEIKNKAESNIVELGPEDVHTD